MFLKWRCLDNDTILIFDLSTKLFFMRHTNISSRCVDAGPETRSYDEFNLREILWITGALFSSRLPAYLFNWMFVHLSASHFTCLSGL